MNIRNFIGYAVFAGMVVYGIYHKIESKEWIKTTATIQKTSFKVEGFRDRQYSVGINYSFDVEGLRYSGSSTSNRKTWEQDARRIEREYSPGKIITILYDPKNPDRSEVKHPGWYGSFSL